MVYPSWHPSGKFVAFSINNTTQDTHPVHRTEVYDKASDVVVYDVEKQEIVDNAYDLSINKYKEIEYIPVEYPPTSEIMANLRALEKEVQESMAELEKMLGDEMA